MSVSRINLFSLLPHDTSNFFTYYGSLTTPPCSEVVIWTVFSETHAISAEQVLIFIPDFVCVPISVLQLRLFRNVFERPKGHAEAGELDIEDKILFNHRPTQPINGRPIYARFVLLPLSSTLVSRTTPSLTWQAAQSGPGAALRPRGCGRPTSAHFPPPAPPPPCPVAVVPRVQRIYQLWARSDA